jgi:hypothetical protein
MLWLSNGSLNFFRQFYVFSGQENLFLFFLKFMGHWLFTLIDFLFIIISKKIKSLIYAFCYAAVRLTQAFW